MSGLKRRTLLQASVATAASTLAAPQIKAQSKPEKLVYVGDNGPWHYSMVEEAAPAFEKQTGIKIDFTCCRWIRGGRGCAPSWVLAAAASTSHSSRSA